MIVVGHALKVSRQYKKTHSSGKRIIVDVISHENDLFGVSGHFSHFTIIERDSLHVNIIRDRNTVATTASSICRHSMGGKLNATQPNIWKLFQNDCLSWIYFTFLFAGLRVVSVYVAWMNDSNSNVEIIRTHIFIKSIQYCRFLSQELFYCYSFRLHNSSQVIGLIHSITHSVNYTHSVDTFFSWNRKARWEMNESDFAVWKRLKP